MPSRISNPALSVPGVLDALQGLSKAANEAAGKPVSRKGRWSS
jgi:hypothetical protein